MNLKFSDVQAGFRKCRGTRVQVANIHQILEKARKFQKNIYFCFMGSRRVGHDWATDTFTFFCFIDYVKAFDCVNHSKLWKILGKRIPDHLTCLLRNLYVCQETTLRTGHETRDGSKLGKEYDKAIYCHPAYLTSMQSTSCEMLCWMNHKL